MEAGVTLGKYVVTAVLLLMVTVGYISLVQNEPAIGWTWYKIATVLLLLAISNGAQFWILRGAQINSIWIRISANLAIWLTFGVLFGLEQLVFRPGLAASVFEQRSEAARFILHSLVMVVFLAFFNTLLGFLFILVSRRAVGDRP
jgi:hypothetical protein